MKKPLLLALVALAASTPACQAEPIWRRRKLQELVSRQILQEEEGGGGGSSAIPGGEKIIGVASVSGDKHPIVDVSATLSETAEDKGPTWVTAAADPSTSSHDDSSSSSSSSSTSGDESLLGEHGVETGLVVSAGGLVALVVGFFVARRVRQDGGPTLKRRPEGFDGIARREGVSASKAEAGQINGRLAGERLHNNKIVVRAESQVDSIRSPGGTGGRKGEFFTLTDIDLATPSKTPKKGIFSPR